MGIDKVLLTASDNNLGSVSTILSLDGILEDKVLDYEDETVLMGRYWIDVNESIKNNYEIYKSKILRKVKWYYVYYRS